MKAYELSVLNNGIWERITVIATDKEDLARRVNSLSYGKIKAIAEVISVDTIHISNVVKLEKYFKAEENYFKQFKPIEEVKEVNIKALGALIALMGAELGRQQVNMSGGKMGNISHGKILKNSDVQFLLNYS